MGLSTAIPSAGRSGAPLLVFLTRGAVLLAALATLLCFTSPGAAENLQLESAKLMDGQPWRLWTCHFMHWTWEHLAYDLFAFVLLTWLCLERRLLATFGALAAAATVIPIAFLAWHPELATYRGLSGLDAALFVLLAGLILREGLEEGRRSRVWLGGLALAGFAAKIAFELATGSAFFATSEAFVPIPVAHVAGAVCGAVAALWPRGRAGVSPASASSSASSSTSTSTSTSASA